MAKAFYDDDPEQWVEIAEPVAPISMRDLRTASALSANFSPERGVFYQQWAQKSIRQIHLADAYGVLIEGPLTSEAFDSLSFEQQKWLYAQLFNAAVEIPLASAPGSTSAPSPAGGAASPGS